MSDSIGIAILAAGEGKRLGKPYPKPLAKILGKSLIDYVFESGQEFALKFFKEHKMGIVVGHQKELMEEHFAQLNLDHVDFPIQEKQLGTADALRSYFAGCSWAKDMVYTLIMCGDTPMLRSEDLEMLWQMMKSQGFSGAAASFITDNPFGYGRIIEGGKGFKIVEEKDATDEERLVQNVNSGLYLLKTDYLLDKLATIGNENKSGEFYLTDVFSCEDFVGACAFQEQDPFLGVNNLAQLNEATSLMRQRVAAKLLDAGVHIMDVESTYIDAQCEIGAGTVIYPGVHLRGKTRIGAHCEIGVGAIIEESHIEDHVNVRDYSHLCGAKLHAKAVVGPFARLREGSVIGSSSKIGNFVELKKSVLGEKVGVSHLSYVGDAEIGDNVNIGCGFITCNYDGESKSKTVIGKNSFVGSDTQTIAPVTLGENTYVASGSTISKDVPDGSFAISRARQENKEGMAKRFLKGKWSLKD